MKSSTLIRRKEAGGPRSALLSVLLSLVLAISLMPALPQLAYADEGTGTTTAEAVQYEAGTYTVTANLVLPGKYNEVLGVDAYATNPDNPLGTTDNDPNSKAALSNAPTMGVENNAELTVAADGSMSLSLDIPNPVFTIQKLGGCDTATVTSSSTVAGTYGTGDTAKSSRINHIDVSLQNTSLQAWTEKVIAGTSEDGKTHTSASKNLTGRVYVFDECAEYPTILSTEWNVQLELRVDFSNVTVKQASTEKVKVDKPTAATDLVYDGSEQQGVPEGAGYTLSGVYKATEAGDYTAIATLQDGYQWSDGTTGALTLTWSIAAAQSGSDADQLKAGTYTVTANLYLNADDNPLGLPLSPRVTNPNNPFTDSTTGKPYQDADYTGTVTDDFPTSDVYDNATLVVGEDGTVTLELDIVNPVFTLQEMGTSSTAAVTDSTKHDLIPYFVNGDETTTGLGQFGITERISHLTIELDNLSGSYVFQDCTLCAAPMVMALGAKTKEECLWSGLPLYLSVDMSEVPSKDDIDTTGWWSLSSTDENTGITATLYSTSDGQGVIPTEDTTWYDGTSASGLYLQFATKSYKSDTMINNQDYKEFSILPPMDTSTYSYKWATGKSFLRLTIPLDDPENKIYKVSLDSEGNASYEEVSARYVSNNAIVDILPSTMTQDDINTYQSSAQNGYYFISYDMDSFAKSTFYYAEMGDPTQLRDPVAGGLEYNGEEQSGILENQNFTITSGTSKAVHAGDYTCTVTLTDAAWQSGMRWKNSETKDLEVTWSIAKRQIKPFPQGGEASLNYSCTFAETQPYTSGDHGGNTYGILLADVEKYQKTGYVSYSNVVKGEDPTASEDWVDSTVEFLDLTDDLTYGDWFRVRVSGGGNADYEVTTYTIGCQVLVPAAELDDTKDPETLVYNGQAQLPSYFIISGADYADFGLDPEESYTISIAKKTYPGEYSTSVSLPEWINKGFIFADGTTGKKTFNWSIVPAPLTATASSATINEGDEFTPEATVTGFVNDETAETAAGYVAPTVTLEDGTSDFSSLAVGAYKLVAAGGAADNYEFSYVAGELKVVADTTALDKAVSDAQAAVSGVTASIDGSDVYTNAKWATPEALKAVSDAVAAAQALGDTATQEEVDAATEALTAATAALNAQPGKKAIPVQPVTPDEPDDPTTPDQPVTPDEPAVASVEMYRLYNPYSGEHFYTASVEERDYLDEIGWNYEGVGWTAPETSGTPVYRLYNPYAGEHHYTVSAQERDTLVAAGWNDEGIAWYSADETGTPVYRLYNPNEFSNNHHYTTSADERDYLIALGWLDEGIAWYGL